jgi:adenosylcobinamide-phosphate synthase
MPHPVRGIGYLAEHMEAPARYIAPGPRSAGILTTSVVVLITGLTAVGMVYGLSLAHPIAGDIASVWLIYSSIAIRDMHHHSKGVYGALTDGNLGQARQRVAMIVGRDTETLDEVGIIRASVESTAESIVDGVTAPLFFTLLAGPVGAIVYRAINTLDSTFGYRHGRYRYFGCASARLDDVANYLPARLTAPLICLSALITGANGQEAFRILWRDARNHTSPNAGLSEAAVAGVLGIQLGGTNYYFGKAVEKPTIGDQKGKIVPDHIIQANRLSLCTSMLFLMAGICLRFIVIPI